MALNSYRRYSFAALLNWRFLLNRKSLLSRQSPGLVRFEFDLAKEGGRFFGRDRIDIETAAPFETRGLGQTRDDFDVRVVVAEFRRVKWSGVNDVVVAGPVERRFDVGHDLPHH